MAFTLIYAAVVAAFLATVVQADEKHTIRFDNRCVRSALCVLCITFSSSVDLTDVVLEHPF